MQQQDEVINDLTNRKTSLDWKQRPEDVNRAIDDAYERISNHPSSKWGCFNGSELYELAGINDHLVIEKMILAQLKQGQNQFVLIDIGAGNFNWGRSAAVFINKHILFNKKIKVSIYSLRGERNENSSSVSQEGICTLYEYGNFKIENLIKELNKCNDNLINKVDIIVSAWCFRHLVDPTGTLLQAYELLRPKTGMIFIDGFFLETPGHLYKTHWGSNLIKLFSSFQAPFFKRYDNDTRRIDCFVMQKSETAPYVPLTYKGVRQAGDNYQIGSRCVTHFEPTSAWENTLKFHIVPNKRGAREFEFDSNSELLFRRVILDHTDIILAKRQKIAALFEQIDINVNNLKYIKNIYNLLKDLGEIDQKQVLICIDTMLLLNKQKALSVLNHHSGKGYGSLLAIFFDANISPVFKKLLKISSTEILNAPSFAYHPHHRRTLLMHAICTGRKTFIELVLSRSDIDFTIVFKGKTASSIAAEKIIRVAKEIQDCKTNITNSQVLLAKMRLEYIATTLKLEETTEKSEQKKEKQLLETIQKNIDEQQQTLEYYIKTRDESVENLKEAKKIESMLKAAIEKQQQLKSPKSSLPAFSRHKKTASCDLQPKLGGLAANKLNRRNSM